MGQHTNSTAAISTAIELVAVARSVPQRLVSEPDGGLTVKAPESELQISGPAHDRRISVKGPGRSEEYLDQIHLMIIDRQLEEIAARRRAYNTAYFEQTLTTLSAKIGPLMANATGRNRYGVNPQGANAGYAEEPHTNAIAKDWVWAKRNTDGKGLGHIIEGHIAGVSFKIMRNPEIGQAGLVLQASMRTGSRETLTTKRYGAEASGLFDTVAAAFARHEKIKTNLTHPE
jgi:hypothetical protein